MITLSFDGGAQACHDSDKLFSLSAQSLKRFLVNITCIQYEMELRS